MKEMESTSSDLTVGNGVCDFGEVEEEGWT